MKYLMCGLSGAIAGAAGMYLFFSPSVKDLATLQANQLQLDYGLVVSPQGQIRSPEVISKNAKTALAVRFLNVAPLYSKLNNERAKESVRAMSKTVMQVKALDALDEGEIKDYSFVSINCIAALTQSNDDPMPCLKSASDKAMSRALSVR
ncbi:hypothetical protein LZZ50_04435 [Xanthomonas arboricola]|uniref:hypothetical protein n=1 Tax=Xanthomonas arboricola TaxID=56448 RepID=UPI0011B0EB9C|nr:hypothetical protein [Xanthomonas arboricola]UOS99626.1 hypothetical protein LZZ50_04435 [Xanthomonas arboricola]